MKKNVDLTKMKIEYIQGQPFLKAKTAARLAGIDSNVLQMGINLLKRPDGQGAVFLLATKELQQAADDLENLISIGLRKVAKGIGQSVKVKCFRSDERLIFWYETKLTRGKKESGK